VLLDVRFNKTTEDILGEEQWVWLENELAESKSEITFIVSPIQVLVLDRPLQEKFSQQWSSYVRLAKLIGFVFVAVVCFVWVCK
jgi:alkaline phosphatase D